MQACAVLAPSLASHPESWAQPAGESAQEVWRSLPESRMRQALNLRLATSRPSGGRSVMAWLLMMRRPASLAMRAQLGVSGHEILSGLRDARFREAPGACSHPPAPV